MIADFNTKLSLAINSITNHIDTIVLDLEKQKQYRIAVLEKSIQIAKTAGIIDIVANASIPQQIVIDSGKKSSTVVAGNDYMYLLGQKYLSAELAVEKSTPVIYPASYYNLQDQLSKLQSIDASAMDFSTYSLQMQPTLPTNMTKPKRALIIVIGLIMGGLIGVFWVLPRDAIRKRKTELG